MLQINVGRIALCGFTGIGETLETLKLFLLMCGIGIFAIVLNSLALDGSTNFVERESHRRSGRRAFLGGMPVLALDPPGVLAALELGGSDLKFLFTKNEVDDELQAMFYHSKVTTLARFTAIVKDADDLKKLILDEFGIDSGANLANRVRVSNVVIAFNTATQRILKQDEVEGELAAKNLVKPLPTTEWAAMREAWQMKFWLLDDDLVPARCYLEQKAEEVEQNEYKAEALTTVLTKDQEDPNILVPVWNSTGSLAMRKGAQTIDEPHNPEQLRRRLKVLGLSIMFLALKHGNRAYLQGFTPQSTEDYLSYLLSENCYYLQGKSAEGFTISGPSWPQLLIYEFQIRRKAWALVNNGKSPRFVDALETAWQDSCVKERYLVTPVALSSSSGSKRVLHTDGEVGNPKGGGPKRAKSGGGGKGSKKGGGRSGKGGGSQGKGGKTGKAAERLGMQSKTPDGQNICYGYNDWNSRCRDRSCRFLHVCGRCYGKHPLYACPPGTQAETQGSGHGTQ